MSLSTGIQALATRLGTEVKSLWTALGSKAERSQTMAVVVHGTDPQVARPAGAVCVTWVGKAEPAQALPADLWLEEL